MKKLLLNLFFLIFLTGCFQTTAMVGPTMTLVSTGNLSHALGTLVTNTAVEKETGMQTHQFLAKKVEEQQLKQEDNRINKELSQMIETNVANKQLVILLQTNINKTKKILNSN